MIIVPHVVAYGHVLRVFSRRLQDSTGCVCVLAQLDCVSAPCSAVRHLVAAWPDSLSRETKEVRCD